MKPTTKELGEREFSQINIIGKYRYGIKSYENGIRITIHKQIMLLRNNELKQLLHSLATIKPINLYERHLFTLIKEKFPEEKGIHRYIDKLVKEKPSFFEEYNKINKEKRVLEEISKK